MTLQEYLLSVVSEESGEIVQAVSKILRFGKNNYNPIKPDESNEDALLTEFYQLQSMIEHLQQKEILKKLTDDEIARIKCRKLEKVYQYMVESKACGTIIDSSDEIIQEKAKAFDEINHLYEDVAIFDDDGSDRRVFADKVCDILCEIENFEENINKKN